MAKSMLDQLKREHCLYEFDPENRCQLLCPLPLRYSIPCRCYMAYFYQADLPLPLLLFYPRWLLDGPSVLPRKWHIRADNPNRDLSHLPIQEDRYTRDKFVNRGEQVILNNTVKLARLYQELLPKEAILFA